MAADYREGACLTASLPHTPPHTWTALKSQAWLEPYIRVKLRTGADKTFLAVSWLTASDLAQLSESLAWTCQEAELSGSWSRGRRNQVVGRQLQISSTRMDPSNQTNTTIRRLVRLWKQKQLKIFLHFSL